MKKSIIKKILALSSISLLLVQVLYFIVEPTLTSAASATDDVIVTLNVDAGITISNGANANMTPNIGITTLKSIGSSSWFVKTNNSAGYTLAVKASTTPALIKGAPSPDSFTDYTPVVGGTPDFWGGVPAAGKEFGFSARGTDSLASFGGASTCGSGGTPDAASKFLGFTTSDQTIATAATVTPFAGTQTFICFAAEQGNAIYAATGAYTATVTATATTL